MTVVLSLTLMPPIQSMGLWKDAQRASALEEHYNSEDSARSHRRQPSALSNVLLQVRCFFHLPLSNATFQHQASSASAAMGSQTPIDRQGPQRSAHFTAYFGGVVKFFNNVLHPCVRYIKDLYPCVLSSPDGFEWESIPSDTCSYAILSACWSPLLATRHSVSIPAPAISCPTLPATAYRSLSFS